MFTILMTAALLAAIAVVAVKVAGRIPQAARAEVAKAGRDLRLRSGNYSLKLLMRRMMDDMLGSVLPSITRSYVPSEMRFGMHPHDARRWGAYFTQVSRELRALMVAEIASRKDLELCGELRIVIVEDSDAAPGRPTFEAGMGRRTPPEPAHPAPKAAPLLGGRDGKTVVATGEVKTEHVTPGHGAAWWLALGGRAPIRLVGGTTVGRGKDAGVRIDDDDLSRVHARFDIAGERVTIVDLGSTNGTLVNNKQVEKAVLEAGDVVGFGRQVNATVHRSAAPPSSDPTAAHDAERRFADALASRGDDA